MADNWFGKTLLTQSGTDVHVGQPISSLRQPRHTLAKARGRKVVKRATAANHDLQPAPTGQARQGLQWSPPDGLAPSEAKVHGLPRGNENPGLPDGLAPSEAEVRRLPRGNENPGLPDGLAPSEAKVRGLASEPTSPVRGEPVGGCGGVGGVGVAVNL